MSLLIQYEDCWTSELSKINLTSLDIELTSDEPVVYRLYRIPFLNVTKFEGLPRIWRIMASYTTLNPLSQTPCYWSKRKTVICGYYWLSSIYCDNQEGQISLTRNWRTAGQIAGLLIFYMTGFVLWIWPVGESSIKKCAFVIPDGFYEYLGLPFGFANASFVFMRLMNMVLNPLKQLNILAYMDVILIQTLDAETGLKNIEIVFN